jgi:hypothetical protein
MAGVYCTGHFFWEKIHAKKWRYLSPCVIICRHDMYLALWILAFIFDTES